MKFNGFYHLGIFVYLVNMSEYASLRLYKDAYKMEFNWEKWLPRKVYEYHDLNYREVNAPVSLQMGVLLPFISLLCGPKTKGHFLTRSSYINLFWINIAASGVGKSQSRERMISQPLGYMMENLDASFQDFEVSKYTRAGNLYFKLNVMLNF